MNAGDIYRVIRRPLITEKSNDLKEGHNQYAFEVDLRANKLQVKQAIETLFGVKVDSVRTSIVRGKWRRVGKTVGRRSNWKKAWVSVQSGQEIDFFSEA